MNAIVEFLVTDNTAGIESIAKRRSADSTTIKTKKSCVIVSPAC